MRAALFSRWKPTYKPGLESASRGQDVAAKVLYMSVLCKLSARFCGRKYHDHAHSQTVSRHVLPRPIVWLSGKVRPSFNLASVHQGRPSLCSETGPRPSEKLVRSPAPPPMDGPHKAGTKLHSSTTPCAHERPEQNNKAAPPHVSFPRRITHHGAVRREMEQIDTLKDPEYQLPDSG